MVLVGPQADGLVYADAATQLLEFHQVAQSPNNPLQI